MYGELVVYFQAFLNSAADGSQLHAPAVLTPGEKLPISTAWRSVYLKVDMDAVEKNKFLLMSEIEPSLSSPYPSHYTD
jgi:hypothetical protein